MSIAERNKQIEYHFQDIVSYEIGYFDGVTFWSSKSALTLKQAKEYLKEYDDRYVIVEKTTSYKVQDLENEI